MSEIFFGPFAVVGWFLAATIFAGCAGYIWRIVYDVGGLRGTILASTYTSLAIICFCFGMIVSRQEWISGIVLGIIVTSVFPPIIIGAIVMTDLYAADRNNHRSLSLRSYTWYRKVTTDVQNPKDLHSPASAHVPRR